MTLGTMKTRVTGELQRPELSAEAADAIGSAIDHYQRQRFNFNVARATFDITPSLEYVGLPADFIEADTLVLVEDSELTFLEERSFHWIDRTKEWENYRSRPTTWAVQQGEMRLYPTPDRTATLRLSFVCRIYEVSAGATDNDDNAWFTDGEELIRTRAKADLLENVIQGQESFQAAAVLRLRERETLGQLRKQYKRAQSSGRINPWN